LSYASQDAEAALRLCTALRNAGIDVWFDHAELRGGDVWDQKIRRQIRECSLFIALISATTRSRAEGYFRLEWKLAVDRSHLIAADRAFLMPVVIDATTESDARVPDGFREVQWTRLEGGNPDQAFIKRVAHLLAVDGPQLKAGGLGAAANAPAARRNSGQRRNARLRVAAIAVFTAGLAGVVIQRLIKPHTPPAAPARIETAASPPAFAPPPHSVAVLAFTNLSGDPKDEYFSDGLSEELLNALAAVRDLKVAARTSSFSFKGKTSTVADMARQLNVGAILEGSVRRDKSHVRISTELINVLTGFQLWSQTYDRDLKDVLKLQTDIAASVSAALKVRLLQSDTGGPDPGGTDNPRAFDAYLRGEGLSRLPLSKETNAQAGAAYDEAITLDPHYANAYVGRASALDNAWADTAGTAAESSGTLDDALAAARKAADLAPDLGLAQTVIGHILAGKLEFAAAAAAYERGIALSPGDARVYGDSAAFLAFMARFDEAVARARRAVELDPLNSETHASLGYVYFLAGRYTDSIESSSRSVQLKECCFARINRGLAYFALGNYEAARQSCEVSTRYWGAELCLAIVYGKMGRRAEAETQRARLEADWGDSVAYQFVEIYGQWGDSRKALDWLDRAMQLHDPGIVRLKVDRLLDPVRAEPRFHTIVAKLNFPH
jgi:TolB-like protein/Tfp pilus assembly protein PilF